MHGENMFFFLLARNKTRGARARIKNRIYMSTFLGFCIVGALARQRKMES